MEGILENIYLSLKENNNCDIWLDPFTRLLLFPIVSNPSNKESDTIVGLIKDCE